MYRVFPYSRISCLQHNVANYGVFERIVKSALHSIDAQRYLGTLRHISIQLLDCREKKKLHCNIHSAIPLHSSCSHFRLEIMRSIIHLKTKCNRVQGSPTNESNFYLCKRISPNRLVITYRHPTFYADVSVQT